MVRAKTFSVWAFIGLGAALACNSLLGIDAPHLVDGCVLNSDCTEPRHVCLFRICSPECNGDEDCSEGLRCLADANGTACVNAAQAACSEPKDCPGSVCSDGVCRIDCSTDEGACLTGQVCSGSVCRGTDPTRDPAPGPAELGTPCGSEGDVACAAVAGRGRLICEAGEWAEHTACSAGSHCNNAVARRGSCDEIPAECEGREPERAEHTFACDDGEWTITSCPGGRLNCDGSIDNGCEANLSSLTHCGSCDAACHLECRPAGCNEASQLALGANHSCARTEAGGVVCWGANAAGQLGDAGTTERAFPAEVAGALSSVVGVASGGNHTCAHGGIQGRAFCWGSDVHGQLGSAANDEETSSTTPLAVTGLLQTGQLEGVSAMAAGAQHSCAVYDDGKVACWGARANGRLGDGEPPASGTAQSPVVAVYEDAIEIDDAVELAAGNQHTCLRTAGGVVACWGDRLRLGRATPSEDVPFAVLVPGLSNVAQIAAGSAHTCARLQDGTVSCWGSNDFGELGRPNDAADPHLPQVISGLTGVTELALAVATSCALKDDGSVVCWGINTHGQRGNSVSEHSHQWNEVSISNVETIAAGGGHLCALSQKKVWCWGKNSAGQLGNGATTLASQPTPVSLLPLGG